MGAPIGNQYAVGHGAPRTVCPSDEELNVLGKELVDWCKKNKRNCMHLKQWYCIEKEMLTNEWDAIRKKESFRPYYEQARAYISINYINGAINPSVANRFLRLYFPEMKLDEDDLLRLKAELAKKEEVIDEENLVRNIAQAIGHSKEIPRTCQARGPEMETQ